MAPDYLFKFVPLSDDTEMETDENEKRFQSLCKNEIWFSLPGKMNDPYEFRGIYLDYDELNQSGISKGEIDKLRYMFEEQYVLSSFTQAMQNYFPMWNHYANGHKGFCIKFKVADDKHLRKVRYTNQRPDVTKGILKAKEIFDMIKDPAFDPGKTRFALGLQKMYMRILVQNYIVKHDSWEYEGEYRIIVERTDRKDSAGQNVPAEQVGLCLDAIYSGYKCAFYERLKTIAEALGVPCYKCLLDEKDFFIFAE